MKVNTCTKFWQIYCIVFNWINDCFFVQCPETMRHTVPQNNDDYEDYNRSTIDIPSEKTLVRLHKRVIQDSQNHHRTHAQWNSLMQKAIDLEDVEKNELSSITKFQRSQHSSSMMPALVRIFYTPVIGKLQNVNMLIQITYTLGTWCIKVWSLNLPLNVIHR